MGFLEYLKDYIWYTIKTYLLPFIIVILSIELVFWGLLDEELSFKNMQIELIYFSCFFLIASFTTYEMKGHKNE